MAPPPKPRPAAGDPMTTENFNTYVVYKRDTKHLLYWMINTSNSIIKKYPNSQDRSSATTQLDINTSGQTTVAGLITMAHLIARYIQPIPKMILQLLHWIIQARATYHKEFQRHAGNHPDANLERSNASHKHFIDALAQVLEAFGGKDRLSADQDKRHVNVTKEEVEEMLFSNKFSVLHVNPAGGPDSDSEQETQHHGQIINNKRAKGRKLPSKKPKKGRKTLAQRALDDIEGIPMENYRLLESDEEIMMEYTMAIYALRNEWQLLRDYLLEAWDDVAYKGMNTVVATGLCKMAVAMVQRSELSIFVDFLGKDSYEMCMLAMTRGRHVDEMQKENVALDRAMGYEGPNLDVREQIMLYAYQALFDFIKDFRHNRNGKPTKAMQAETEWDPTYAIADTTNKKRIKWRRAYAICWLYDLVNVFSSPFFEHGLADRQQRKKKLEDVDWTTTKVPWQEHRGLFGLNDFAAWVTTLAMQKPGTDGDLAQKILPHHVFQLQCILDSMTVTVGWSFDDTGAHLLKPFSRDFCPRRDIHDFFSIRLDKAGANFRGGVTAMLAALKIDGELHSDHERHYVKAHALINLENDLLRSLGTSYLVNRESADPPSRFLSTNANGLWEFSPYMCGEGLAEALQLAYIAGMWLMDVMPEPTMALHIYNMLVEKERMEPSQMYGFLQREFRNCFFVDGQPPKSDFKDALVKQCGIQNHGLHRFRRRERRLHPKTAGEIRVGQWMFEQNQFFRRKSMLMLYAESNWNPSRIPDSELGINTMVTSGRVGRTKEVIDPVTGERRLEDTDLIKHLKSLGMDEKFMFDFASMVREERKKNGDYSGDETLPRLQMARRLREKSDPQEISAAELMESSKHDLLNDMSGQSPLSGINFLWVAAEFADMFTELEVRLSREQNPLFQRVYENNSRWSHLKRVGLTRFMMEGRDEACMDAITDILEASPEKFEEYLYWQGSGVPMCMKMERNLDEVLKSAQDSLGMAYDELDKWKDLLPGLVGCDMPELMAQIQELCLRL